MGIYYNEAELAPHRDNNQCEYTMSVQVCKDLSAMPLDVLSGRVSTPNRAVFGSWPHAAVVG